MLKFLLVILILFFLLRSMGRVMIFRSFQDMQQRRNQDPSRPEGHVTIEGQEKRRNNKDSSGEYVDYEEVK
jgi:hypothetical protein